MVLSLCAKLIQSLHHTKSKLQDLRSPYHIIATCKVTKQRDWTRNDNPTNKTLVTVDATLIDSILETLKPMIGKECINTKIHKIGKIACLQISCNNVSLRKRISKIPGVKSVEPNKIVSCILYRNPKQNSASFDYDRGMTYQNTHRKIHTCTQQKIFGLNSEHRIPDEYLIRIKPGSTDYLHSAKSVLGSVSEYKIGASVFLSISCKDENSVKQLSQLPGVQYVETNKTLFAPPNDASDRLRDERKIQVSNHISCDVNEGLWGHSRVMQRNPETRKRYFYKLYETGEGVNVYVFDSGVNIDHSDFEGRASYGFEADEFKGDAIDRNGHGTHIAGTIAGKTYGLAKQANIISVKVLGENGDGSAENLIAGIEYVYKRFEDMGKHKSLCNMSLGLQGTSKAIEETLDEAALKGIPFVVAAGNSGVPACQCTPARSSSVITVGATDIKDQILPYSNYGRCVDIFAPGWNIKSACYTNNYGSDVQSGTSMAAAHVTGALALYLSTLPNMPKPDELMQWIKLNATRDAIHMNGREGSANLLLYIGHFIKQMT